MDPILTQIKIDKDYPYADVIVVDKVYDSFWAEHYHGDSTVRYILNGTGYFDLKDINDQWVRIHVRKGDFMEWPAGIYHRFIVDKGNFITAMRLNKNDPVWESYARTDHICTNKTTARYSYIKDILCNEDPDVELCNAQSNAPSESPSLKSGIPSLASNGFLVALALIIVHTTFASMFV